MQWSNDWPVIGVDREGRGQGEPVLSFKKPNVGRTWPKATPPDSDEFNENGLGLQWQWQANPQPNWAFPSGALGFVRLFAVPPPKGFQNLWDSPNLLLQKFPAPEFTVTTKVTFTAHADGDKSGLIIMGRDYAYLSVTKSRDGLVISQVICKDADRHSAEIESTGVPLRHSTFYLRVKVSANTISQFSYSTDGREFIPIGERFTARQGRWIGAKVGIFALGTAAQRENSYADFDWFHVE
jgi:beta-xylosidase